VEGGDGYVIGIQAEEDRGDHSYLRHASPHVVVRRSSSLERRFERLTLQVGLNGFHQVRGEFEGTEPLGKAVDPYCVECLGHIKENCACELLLA
jgi:hypothetical protein